MNIKLNINYEKIFAILAYFVGLAAVGVSVYSAYTDHEYARLSVWPRLDILRSQGSNYFKYEVSNNGIGPALIKYAKIKHDGKIIHHWADIPEMKNIRQSHIGTKTLPSLVTIYPVTSQGSQSIEIADIDHQISIELCYCSIYKECWLTNKENNPIAIDICSIDDRDRFLQ